jgi:mono/diheme cytochrome c family protein
VSSSGCHPRGLVRAFHLPALAAALAVSLACAGGGDETPGTTDTGGAPAGGAPAGQGGDFTPQQITAQMIALGDSIFRGQAANGICFTCHAPDATGTQLGPNLTDQEWIQGDGSLTFILNNVRTGVLQPQQFPGVMPPFGPLFSEEQLRAVSAYVYSRSHPDFQVGGGN